MTAPGSAEPDGTAPDAGTDAQVPDVAQVPDGRQPAEAPQPGTGEATRRRWWAEAAATGGTSALLDCPDASRGALDLTTAHPSGLAQLLAGGPAPLSSLVREAGAFADARQRARATHERAEVLREQQGLATLAVAVGLVGWAGPDGAAVRRTPLLLRRCTLAPTGAAHDDFVVQLDPAVVVNPVLLSTVAAELGVQLDGDALAAAVVSGRGFDPAPALRQLREALHGVPGLRVDARLVLGTFADPAADLLTDLRRRGGAVRDHRVVRALAEQVPVPPAPGPTNRDDPATGDGASTAGAPAARAALDDGPLPLDPAQRRVLARVLAGEDLRVEAPTGTGATQVAAAVVAGLAAAGRTTLLVADAAAELRAVQERLADAGLGTLVLHVVADLAQAPVTRSVLAQRDAALEAVDRRRAAVGEVPQPPDVQRLLDVLDAHATALHRRREPWGVSASEAVLALAELAGRPAAPSTTRRLRGASLQACARADLPAWAARLAEAVDLGAFDVTPATSPWTGSRITTDEGAAAAQRALTRVVDDELPRARALMATLTDAAGLRGAASVADASDRVALLEGVRLTVSRFGPDIWGESLGDVSVATATPQWRRDQGVRMGALTRWRLRRQARALLRPGTTADSVEQLNTWLLDARAQRLAWQRVSQGKGSPHVPEGLADAQIAVASLRGDLEALQAVLPSSLLPDGPLRSLQLPELTTLLRALHADTAALGPLPRRTQLMDELADGGWQPLLEDLAARWAGPGSLDLTAEVEAAWWSGVLEVLSLEDPLVGAVDAAGLRQARAELVLADATRRVLAGRRLREALDARAGAGRGTPTAGDPLAGPGAAATAAVLPCWALSPASAAVVLGADEEPSADVVVVLGAQASTTASLLPALSRGRQVVVVGDPALPGPRAIATAGAAAGAPAAGAPAAGGDLLAESAAVLATERLDRQHACLDEDLLPARLRAAQSTVPGARRGSRRLARTSSRPIGARRGPEALADLVHAVVQEHLDASPGESLGVVLPDADTAAAVLDVLRRRVPRPAAGTGAEDVLVAALERWPGRRRDHVVVVADSVRGPVAGLGTGAGGAADVALALTRARRRCTVVLDDSTLDEGRPGAAAEGAAHPGDGRGELLRTALAWDTDTDTDTDTDVEDRDPDAGGDGARGVDALVRRLEQACAAAGLPTARGVGRSLAVPLAVRDTGSGPALAVELDGRDWAAADVLDREVALPGRWERAGWHYVRSLSVDVLRDPALEAARIGAVWQDEVLAVRPPGRSIDLRHSSPAPEGDLRDAGSGDDRQAPR